MSATDPPPPPALQPINATSKRVIRCALSADDLNACDPLL